MLCKWLITGVMHTKKRNEVMTKGEGAGMRQGRREKAGWGNRAGMMLGRTMTGVVKGGMGMTGSEGQKGERRS